jgi:hypothetical protein
MDEDQLFLRPTKPSAAGIDEHTYRVIDNLDFIKAQFAQVPTRKELWSAVILGTIIGAGVSMTIAETISRACS